MFPERLPKGSLITRDTRSVLVKGITSIAEKLGGVVFCRSWMMEGEDLMVPEPRLAMGMIKFHVNLDIPKHFI